MQHTAGLDILVRKVNTWGLERLLRIQLMGSDIHATPESLPDLYNIFLTARDRLAIPITPEFYIRNAGDIKAYTAYGLDVFCRSCGHCLPAPHPAVPAVPAVPATASAPLAAACPPTDGTPAVAASAVLVLQ